ncbi:uncharacterized protein LOC128241456 isoform X2 [Mya arenaria]|nr:uncharacterized protein LOC128241456 isoform X2 [Mya arenaria]
MTRIIRLRSMSESTADRSEFSDFRHHWHAAVGLLFAAEVFAVCLQEVHVHGQELRPLHRHFELPIILTAADTISLLILLKVECADGLKKHSEGLIVSFLCHVVMEYLVNFWYIYSRNDSFAVGYFEPVLMILLLKVCTKTEVNLKIGILLIAMSFCAGCTSGEIGILTNANRNGIIIFLVTMFLCMRNIALKRLHEEKVFFKVRKSIAIPYTFVILSFGVILSAFHLTYWALPVMFSLISIFASVSALYCTGVLLESMHVISISVLGLVSQIAINVVSIPVEHKHNVIISMAGALVLFCIIGLYFQTFSNVESTEILGEPVPHHEVYTRLEFLTFVGIVCGLIFYVFKPKLSERDLNNLHFVGLDNIVKTLLRHQ